MAEKSLAIYILLHPWKDPWGALTGWSGLSIFATGFLFILAVLLDRLGWLEAPSLYLFLAVVTAEFAVFLLAARIAMTKSPKP